jgi:hypothetical protein
LPSDLPIDKDAIKKAVRKEGYFPLHGLFGVSADTTAPGAPARRGPARKIFLELAQLRKLG